MAVAEEIHAALGALENRYPGRVTREDMVLAGFSLGGILTPAILELNPLMFETVIFVEGGMKQLDGRIGALKRAGVEGVGLAMSSPRMRATAKGLVKKIARRGHKVVFVDMRGAGHNYSDDFPETGNQALRTLLESSPVQ